MVCIARRPRCGIAETEVVPEPLTRILKVSASVSLIISVATALGKAVGAISVSATGVAIASISIGGAGGAGALSAALAAITMIVVILLYAIDRCNEGKGLPECVAGVVHEVVASFSSGLDELFPFSAMHDRVDLITRSRYWDVVESGEAFVFCTSEETPRRSEIMRCYFFDSTVCAAAKGAVVGGIAGGVAGVIVAAVVVAAIGCATVVLCVFALILAAVIAIVAVIIGALVGGQIAKAASDDDMPGGGWVETLSVGHLVTVHGSMKRREYDEAANVIYWAHSAQFHGNSASPRPFSYCEIDDELVTDGCIALPADIF